MAKKEKKPATQQILHGDSTFLYEANSQGSQESKQQELAETPINDIIERPSKT